MSSASITFPLVFDMDTNTTMAGEDIGAVEDIDVDAIIEINVFDPAKYFTLKFKQGDEDTIEFDVDFITGSIQPFDEMKLIDWVYYPGQTLGTYVGGDGTTYSNPSTELSKTWTSNISKYPSNSVATNLQSIFMQFIGDHYFNHPLATAAIENDTTIGSTINQLLTQLATSWTKTGTTITSDDILLAKRSVLEQFINDAADATNQQRIQASSDGTSTFTFLKDDSVDFLIYFTNSVKHDNDITFYGDQANEYIPPVSGEVLWSANMNIQNRIFFHSNYLYCISRTDLVVLDTSDGSTVATYAMNTSIGATNRVNRICTMTPDRQYLALLPYSKSTDWRIFVYHRDDWTTVAYTINCPQQIYGMEFSSTALIVHCTNSVYVYNIEESTYTSMIAGTGTAQQGNGFCLFDDKVYVAYNYLREMDLTTNTVTQQIDLPIFGSYAAYEIEVCDNYIIIGTKYGYVQMYNRSDLSLHKEIEPPFDPNATNYVYDLTINKDATLFAVTYKKYDGVHVYDMVEGTLKLVTNNHENPKIVQSSVDDVNTFAATSGSGFTYYPSIFKVGDNELFTAGENLFSDFSRKIKLRVKMS